MVKSSYAFKNISEVAGELNLPQHVLRFWETKFNSIKPVKRGGGRRYYRPEDVDNLRRIQGLLYDDGYTIKGVQKLYREGGKATVKELKSDSRKKTSSKVDSKILSKLQLVLSELKEIRSQLQG
jgi:DNA-binding transcriptional MerR regulator